MRTSDRGIAALISHEGIVTTVAAGVIWLIRRVFTNQQQIEEMRKELTHRDRLRDEDRKVVQEVREDMKDTRDAVKRIEGMMSRGN